MKCREVFSRCLASLFEVLPFLGSAVQQLTHQDSSHMLLLSVFLVLIFEIHSLYKNIVPWLTKEKISILKKNP